MYAHFVLGVTANDANRTKAARIDPVYRGKCSGLTQKAQPRTPDVVSVRRADRRNTNERDSDGKPRATAKREKMLRRKRAWKTRTESGVRGIVVSSLRRTTLPANVGGRSRGPSPTTEVEVLPTTATTLHETVRNYLIDLPLRVVFFIAVCRSCSTLLALELPTSPLLYTAQIFRALGASSQSSTKLEGSCDPEVTSGNPQFVAKFTNRLLFAIWH